MWNRRAIRVSVSPRETLYSLNVGPGVGVGGPGVGVGGGGVVGPGGGVGVGPGVGRIEPGRQAAMAMARAAPSTAASAGLVRARRTDRFTGSLPAARL